MRPFGLRGRSRREDRIRRPLHAAAVCLFAVACSRGVASVLLDLPPPDTSAQQEAQAQQLPSAPITFVSPVVQDTVRPPIEQFLRADTVKALLPRDHAGNIDWMAALRSGLIKPRSALPDSEPMGRESDFRFAYDFFFPGPDTTMKAYFPHSSHTEWADCKQCHARIFPYRNTPISMGEIFQGKYCGECHGKVAFPVTSACERCHVNLSLPPNRAQPNLIGTIVMKRPSPELAADSGAPRRSLLSESLALAQFPHWLHRIRFRCKVCHMGIFEPRAGSNRVTMQDISAGKACGQCHNGRTAFEAGFGNCQRCHVNGDAAGPGGAG